MKTFKTLLCICAIALCSGAVAFAQDEANTDTKYGPYLTNKFKDNWFIGLGGGVNVAVDGLATKGDDTVYGIGGAAEVFVGKWFTPCWGARIGWQGIFSRMNDGEVNKAPFNYLHGDLMWNWSNQFGGYKETRVYNAIPYLHGGYLGDIIRKKGEEETKHGQEFGVGCGLLNNFRLHERVNFYIDLRCLLTRGEQFRTYTNGVAGMFSALAGLSFNLGKPNWGVSTAAADAEKIAALDEANKALADAKDALAKQNKSLADKCDSLEKAGGNEVVKWMKSLFEGPATVYFELGKTELTGREKDHLNYFASMLLAKDDETTFYLTGSADSSTGSKARNEYLGNERVKYVADILKNKYNIPEDRIVIRESVLYDDKDAPEMGRSVIIDNK